LIDLSLHKALFNVYFDRNSSKRKKKYPNIIGLRLLIQMIDYETCLSNQSVTMMNEETIETLNFDAIFKLPQSNWH